MPDATPVELFYSGTEVEDGTVPVDDMVDALVGFSGAYGKIARRHQTPDTGHRIRVVGLQKGSAKILIEIVEWTAKNPVAAGVLVTAGGMIGTGAYKIIKDIAGVIWGKKARREQTAGDRRPSLRHVADASWQETRNIPCFSMQAHEGSAERPGRLAARSKHAGTSQRCGCSMKQSQIEKVGKIFVVLAEIRRCLICDGMFTPTQAATHAAIPCYPRTKPELLSLRHFDYMLG